MGCWFAYSIEPDHPVVTPTATSTASPTATATHVSSNPFDDVWRTTDAAVAGGSASYSWFWGPSVNFEGYEQYAQSPGG
ncbi:MAG: hypothetical protein DCC58_20440, partial [Chloroflexi bacterium]